MIFALLWILYWVCLLAVAMAALWLVIYWYGHRELEQYHSELADRIRSAELEYLKTKKTTSRVTRPKDL